MKGVSVVVPVFNSASTLRTLVALCHSVLDELQLAHELILVDDGSTPETWEVINNIAVQDPRVTGIRLGRNYGQHNALLAGIRAAKHEFTITIDDDLQNPPDQIPLLLRPLLGSSHDVIYGVPAQVAQTTWRRIAGRNVRRLLARPLASPEAAGLSSFRAFRTSLRTGFESSMGPGVSIDALLAWTTNRFLAIEVEHSQRAVGRSQYSFRKLLRLTVDTMTGYSALPLRIASLLGFFSSFLGFLLMVIFVLVPFFQGVSVQGFPFIASTIIFFAGIQLITLGIVGEYLARMHFRIMNKPEYFVIEKKRNDSIQ